MSFCRNRWGVVATVLAMLAAPLAALAADGTFDKTLSVSGQVILSLNTGSGYIHVSSGPDGEVHIVGHVHAGSWGDFGSAQDRVNDVVAHPPIEQSGNIIMVGKHTSYHNISIDYDVTTPKGTELEANSGSGDLRLLNLGGSLRANTGSGEIEASGLTGRVALQTGSGDIHAEMHAANDVKAQTGSGSIHLQGVQGALYTQTGSGDIEVNGQPATNWKLQTGSGSVTLNLGNAKFSLDASTGSGSIHSDPPHQHAWKPGAPSHHGRCKRRRTNGTDRNRLRRYPDSLMMSILKMDRPGRLFYPDQSARFTTALC